MIVLIFVSTDCPISNRYAPEIQRLYKEFAPRGVRLELVYPNPADDDVKVKRHLAEFGYPPTIGVRDPEHVLVKSVRATITPEAVLLAGDKRVLYRGRIDDRFAELGVERPAPTTHDLRDALAAALAGKPVTPPTTQAVGCFIADMARGR